MEGHNAYHRDKLLTEGKPEEAALLPYFQDTLQPQTYGRHGKQGYNAYHKLLTEGKPGEAALLPYFQDTLQPKTYGKHGKQGHDTFKELVEKNKMSLARDTPYYQDQWQYEAYGIVGHATYKEVTAKVREHASEILTVQSNGGSGVHTMWMCTASCCATKGRWYGRKDKFNLHRKKHARGNASFVETDNKTQNRTKLGYCSLCPSPPMTLMKLGDMKRHLASAGIQV